jgi:hypothetical protein
MNYLLKLPFKQTLSLDDKMAREEIFAEEFLDIIHRYRKELQALDHIPVYSITHDFNDNYIRLYVDAPKLPKDMEDAIEHAFNNTFSGKMNSPKHVYQGAA